MEQYRRDNVDIQLIKPFLEDVGRVTSGARACDRVVGSAAVSQLVLHGGWRTVHHVLTHNPALKHRQAPLAKSGGHATNCKSSRRPWTSSVCTQEHHCAFSAVVSSVFGFGTEHGRLRCTPQVNAHYSLHNVCSGASFAEAAAVHGLLSLLHAPWRAVGLCRLPVLDI